jgi:hypothetical protein
MKARSKIFVAIIQEQSSASLYPIVYNSKHRTRRRNRKRVLEAQELAGWSMGLESRC